MGRLRSSLGASTPQVLGPNFHGDAVRLGLHRPFAKEEPSQGAVVDGTDFGVMLEYLLDQGLRIGHVHIGLRLKCLIAYFVSGSSFGI